MCIIAYAPVGAQIKEETIRQMFAANPDGAGIMWKPADGAPVEIRKGFFNADELVKVYGSIPVDCEKAMHCRIATSGKIGVSCCHPFPVRPKVKAMGKASDKAAAALMHNGVISYCEPTAGMRSKYSDSMLFTKNIIYPLLKQLDLQPIQTLIENSTSSRLLIMRQNERTLLFGDWDFEDGVYYSNGSYKPGGGQMLGGWFWDDCGGSWYSGWPGVHYDPAPGADCDAPALLADEQGNPGIYGHRYWLDIAVNSGRDSRKEEEIIESIMKALEDMDYLVEDFYFGGGLFSAEIEGPAAPNGFSEVAGYKVQYWCPTDAGK